MTGGVPELSGDSVSVGGSEGASGGGGQGHGPQPWIARSRAWSKVTWLREVAGQVERRKRGGLCCWSAEGRERGGH
eukprot:2265282-Rhodomonas_salina.1